MDNNLITTLPLELWQHLGTLTEPADTFGVQWLAKEPVDHWHYLFVSREKGAVLYDTVYLWPPKNSVRGYTRTEVGTLHIAGKLFVAHKLEMRPPNRGWWNYFLTGDMDDDVAFIIAAHRGGDLDDYDLWDVLSAHHGPIPSNIACQIYETLGFVPFAGYPLQRVESG